MVARNCPDGSSATRLALTSYRAATVVKLTRQVVMLVALALVVRIGTAATIYKCIDQYGETNFSDRQCNDAQDQTVLDIEDPERIPDSDNARRLESVLQDLESSRKERQAARERKHEDQAEVTQAKRERICNEALAEKARIGTTPTGQFYRRELEEKSRVEPLSRASAEIELERLQKTIDKNCEWPR